MEAEAHEALILRIGGGERGKLILQRLMERCILQGLCKTGSGVWEPAASVFVQTGEIALFIRFLAEIAAQIPKGLRKLHAFMPGRFGKLHVGGIFALFQKLTDTLYGFMPAYDLCGVQIA